MQLAFDLTSSVTPSAGPEIVYRRLGRGETMLVFHGGSGSYRHWIRNLGALAERFTVYALDLPGFGDSGDVPQDISLEDYVGRTAEAVQLMCPDSDPFHVVGFSFGGMIGAGLVTCLKPRMTRLTLLAPGGMGRSNTNSRSYKLLRARPHMEEEEILAIHRTNLENMMLRDAGKIDEDTVTLHRESIERARFRNWGLSWTDSVVGYLAQSEFPVQFLIGEYDVVARPSVANRLERVRAAKPDIRTHVVPGAGHWAQYESPDTVNALLLGFHADD